MAKGAEWKFDKEEDSFYVEMKSMGENGEIEKNGRIRIRLDILSQEDAEKGKVGTAREEPNHSPFLPPPIGRLSLSLNPCTMF